MKLNNLFLASSSVLVLSAAGALADNNAAYLDQNGLGNSALVTQSGSNASAGDSNAQRRMTQDGDDNELDISQTGSGKVGTGANYAQNNLGVDQLGDKNKLEVTQNFGSSVFEVQQDSNGATGALAVNGNVVSILQTGNMRVSRVRQTYTGDGTAGTENSLEVSQTGGQYQQSGIGDFNGFNGTFAKQGVWQNGSSNTATVVQTSAGQRLWLLDQNGTSNSFELSQTGGNGNKFQTAEQFGTGNSATFSFVGTSNGDGMLSGAAAASGAPNRSLYQNGMSNEVSMTATGSSNMFGFSQTGTDNSAINIALLGSGNELGVVQNGDRNTLNLGTVDGNDNNVGLNQVGNDNIAALSITGDSNGSGLGFSGAAGIAAAGLASGLVSQIGTLNTASLTVTGNMNAFTLASTGDSNSITGVMSGDSHQAAVVQVGSFNVANYSQVGNGNNAGISQ